MISNWQVIYFVDPQSSTNPVSEFLDSLHPKQQAKILRILMYIQEYGLQVAIPHLKKLFGTPLWEIRVLGQDNIRILYVVPFKKTVLLLHGFIKKKQKTPKKEIDTALKRYTRWKLMAFDK